MTWGTAVDIRQGLVYLLGIIVGLVIIAIICIIAIAQISTQNLEPTPTPPPIEATHLPMTLGFVLPDE